VALRAGFKIKAPWPKLAESGRMSEWLNLIHSPGLPLKSRNLIQISVEGRPAVFHGHGNSELEYMMADGKKTEKESPKNDLRKGVHGSLTQPMPPLAGGGSIYGLEDPPIASPDNATTPGQTTHE
jgi:hypothetical protein